MIKVVRAKLHGIRVTDANLNYQGSITLDPEHCEAVGIVPLEFVEIWNKNSGTRISTYVIYGERGSRACVLNGSAARSCQPGDEVIIAASWYCQPTEIAALKPRVLTFDADNGIAKALHYDVTALEEGRYGFAIRDGLTPADALEPAE